MRFLISLSLFFAELPTSEGVMSKGNQTTKTMKEWVVNSRDFSPN